MDGFEQLIHDFAKEIGIPDLNFNSEDMLNLLVDKKEAVTFYRDYERHHLTMVGLIASPLPAEISREMFLEFLSYALNPMRSLGPGIGYDPSSETLMLYQSFPLNELDYESFRTRFGDFIEEQKSVVARLTGTVGTETESHV